MNKEKIVKLLKEREFISAASADSACRPNAAPKFILKIEGNAIYLVDYVIGTTYHNLKVNPRISLSFMDTDTLFGYQLNGPVEIIEVGAEYEKILREVEQRQLDLSTKRIIEGVTHGKVHEGFEVTISEKFVIFKVKIEEVVEISHKGTLKRGAL